MTLDPKIAARLKRNADGLVTAVVQERGSGDVLMVAWMNDEALAVPCKPVRPLTIRDPVPNNGSRARRPATPSTFTRCAWIVTATPYC